MNKEKGNEIVKMLPKVKSYAASVGHKQEHLAIAIDCFPLLIAIIARILLSRPTSGRASKAKYRR